MTASYPTKLMLILSFLLSIYLVGIVQAFIEIAQGERPQCLNLFVHQPTQKNLRAYESEMEKTSWFSKKLQPWMRLFQFVVLKEAGDKALLGKQGWFFYRPGYRYLVEPLSNKPNNPHREILDAAVHFRDQLQQRGIQLVVMPAPGKESVYPDRLTSSAKVGDREVYRHTQEILSALHSAGIETFDLFEAFQNARLQQEAASSADLYLAQDTHWSPEGIRVAARALAAKIAELNVVEKGSVDYRFEPVSLQRHGDVVRMMDIPLTAKLLSPQNISSSRIVHSDSGEPYRDDPASPILILGDSFLRIFERDEPQSAGLISHLAYELKQPLASIVSDGGASTLVRQELARRPELLQNKKLLVWEFVDRDIRFGTEGWQKVSLR